MEILSLTILFYIVANPIGNSPIILALIKDFDFSHQKSIMLREGIFAFFIALFFQFFGEVFLHALLVEPYSLTYCGGILLFLVALRMIFPQLDEGVKEEKREPYFVPISTPLIAGPGLMTVIMAKTQETPEWWVITAALIFAFIPIVLSLVGAPYMQRILKKRGMIALEQLMGMILMLIAVDMVVNATIKFLNTR